MNLEEYERHHQFRYAELAKTISSILSAALARDKIYMLQQIKERAKSPLSLGKKLNALGLVKTETLEADVKDLAGCRIVFYTDMDVSRFLNSGIVETNFEVVETKVHYPARNSEDASNLYISNHYVVKLTADRLAFPEYAQFADMRCEVQIQTILNHSWAEMAHDTIYKQPDLGTFGVAQFEAIEGRMKKVARSYLLPAGYEFQKIVNDFQQLVRGKELHDNDALGAIAAAVDNNVRAEALETFAKHVLPFYGNLQDAYPDVLKGLVAGVVAAHRTAPAEIETPYGSFAGKTLAAILKKTADVLSHYRYVAPGETFDAVRQLYGLTHSEDDRKPLLQVAQALAKHNFRIWESSGPAAQQLVVERVAAMSDEECRATWHLLVPMLGEVLGTEVGGTSSTSTTVSFHRGAVVASGHLGQIRSKALDQLERLFALALHDKERGVVLMHMQTATRHPMGGNWGVELSLIVTSDTHRVIQFEQRVFAELSLGLRQSIEHRLHRDYLVFSSIPEHLAQSSPLVEAWEKVAEAALAFRDHANADPDFVMFKLLVGFESVYPPAWVNREFDYAEGEVYRDAEIAILLDNVTDVTVDEWFDRISRYARTESTDLATFPKFAEFIRRFSEQSPSVGFAFIQRMDETLGGL